MPLTFNEDCPVEDFEWKQCLRGHEMLLIKKQIGKNMPYGREVLHACINNIREDLGFTYVSLSLHVGSYVGSVQEMWIVFTDGVQ